MALEVFEFIQRAWPVRTQRPEQTPIVKNSPPVWQRAQ